MVGILAALSFAGCLESDEFQLDSQGTVQDQYNSIEVTSEMPERRFEPTIILDTPELEVPQGSNPELNFTITDMKDYPFPVTFIDWALFHDRNPNPVAEGDATDLPGSYNQTLYAPGYHMYGFRADDTQALNETRILIIEVGEHEDEAPTEYQIAHFRWRIDTFFGDAGIEPLPPVGETIVDLVELVPQRHMAYWRTDNSYCEETGSGNVQTVNAVWLDIDPNTWGQDFFTEFGGESGLLVAGMRWAAGSTTISYQYDTDSGEYYEIDGVVPDGATRVYFFSCGGIPGLMQAFYTTGISETNPEFPDDPACRTDTAARFLGATTSGAYVSDVGGVWVYQESNGISGLQRSDTSGPGACVNADTLIF